MPLTVNQSDPPGSASYQEFNAAGQPVPPLGLVQYASDNPGVCDVDPNTGALVYNGVGTCNIAGADSGVADGLVAQDSITVNPPVQDNKPVSATLTLMAGVAGGGVKKPSAFKFPNVKK